MQSIELPLETLKPGVPLRIEDGAVGIVVIRGGDSISAFEDACPHARWRLSDGELCAGILECPGHGWEFDVEDGRCLNVPAYQLRRYDVVVEDGLVRIICSNAPPKAVEPKSPAEDSSGVRVFDVPTVQVGGIAAGEVHSDQSSRETLVAHTANPSEIAIWKL